MIGVGYGLCAKVLGGELSVRATTPLPLAAMYLGAQGFPSWEALRGVAPVTFDAQTEGAVPRRAAPEIPAAELDFGDSSVRCASNAAARVQITSSHAPGDPRHLPTAFGFAFAQQWARLGHACIHGALLQVDGRGVLVLGQRGAGKSVLATSALAAGGAIVSDDHLLVGQKEGALLGERIRAFLSLRQSWAARTLFSGSRDVWRRNARDTRAFLRVDDADPRFPDHCRIDSLWLLQRPRAGRRRESMLEPVSQSAAFAALISATQPLLLGQSFPHERDLLTSLFIRLASQTRPARLETGQDIVLEPQATWKTLLAQ